MDLNAELPRPLPFLNGVYVAVDAIPGSFLVVDGPYCVFTKAEMQYGHNIRCRLIPPLGRAAVVHTAVRTGMEEVTSLSSDRVAAVAGVFDRVCAYPEAEVVFATSFDFHELLNFPLAAVAAEAGRRAGRLVCPIPSASLSGDWLEGYSRTCAALARGLPLSRGRGRRDTVAVVGYLYDRDEPDHRANLAELKRLLAGLGLKLSSVWLSGSGPADLRKVASASALLSLPYARDAARVLGRRLSARVVEVDLPLGLTATESFVRAVAGALGKEAQAERFLGREVPAAVRDTKEHVVRVVSGRTAVLSVCDPHLRRGLLNLASDLGLETASEPDGPRLPEADARPLVIGSGRPAAGQAAGAGSVPAGIAVPFGYPNYEDHPVVERPFLGFAGWRSLVEELAGRILREEAAEENRR
ncbi:MAG: hypothetical protein HY924_07045 [Elusimicrobia bacterium]|nr:hypothetical protein [Elusimicrobiota bacterium]